MRDRIDLDCDFPVWYTIRKRRHKNISRILGFGLIFSGIGFGIGCLVYGFTKK
ncbi:MAG: hypothetical protein GX308_07865 [Epulopiscium sp.]|nr:hypothetical protein [Candidatus Epulonipiscium sp.]